MSSLSLRTEQLPKRFTAKLRVEDRDCWTWVGRKTRNGYGRFYIGTSREDQRYASSHRWAYERLVGLIPDGLDLDHLCRNRACCNPDHLEPVTRGENVRRGVGPAVLGRINGSKTHCVNGHEFTASNTRLRPTGGRACRQCVRDRRTARGSNLPDVVALVAD